MRKLFASSFCDLPATPASRRSATHPCVADHGHAQWKATEITIAARIPGSPRHGRVREAPPPAQRQRGSCHLSLLPSGHSTNQPTTPDQPAVPLRTHPPAEPRREGLWLLQVPHRQTVLGEGPAPPYSPSTRLSTHPNTPWTVIIAGCGPVGARCGACPTQGRQRTPHRPFPSSLMRTA